MKMVASISTKDPEDAVIVENIIISYPSQRKYDTAWPRGSGRHKSKLLCQLRRKTLRILSGIFEYFKGNDAK